MKQTTNQEPTPSDKLYKATELLMQNKITVGEHKKFLNEVIAENIRIAKQLQQMKNSK